MKTSLDKLRFSLQFGKRIGPFIGRFGIKESTGGFGGDLLFLDDRLTLSADLFDARSNEYPRLQGRGAVAVYNRNLFLIAGVDDVLNQQRGGGRRGVLRLVLRPAAGLQRRGPEVVPAVRRLGRGRRGRQLAVA